MGAPCRHTCPDIDKIITAIKMARSNIAEAIEEEDAYQIKYYLGCADDELYRLDDHLEDLRASNHALRDWGYDLEERIKELEKQLSSNASI